MSYTSEAQVCGDALVIQDACNLSGVAHSLAGMCSYLRGERNLDTDGLRRHCCTQGVCPFGAWDRGRQCCAFLTVEMQCALYREIKDLLGARLSPAFGAGCSSPVGKTMRGRKLEENAHE